MSRSSLSSSSELLRAHCAAISKEEAALREGGSKAGHERQRKMGRLPVRERIDHLLDKDSQFFEIGLWAAYKMYEQWGEIPAAGAVTGIGDIAGVPCMIIANDATVKAGAFFPQTAKKVLRAQRIAFECALPIVYLVDSAGVFLPMQDEIFPDEDDFGRIFRNNSVISAASIPQFAAIMGNCVAGGAYLPVLCDKILMTEGSGLYLAGPSLVKAAIGQVVDQEELGGAKMHSEISGTVDFYEKSDESCLKRLRSLVALLPEAQRAADREIEIKGSTSAKSPDTVYDLVSLDGQKNYDVRDLLATIVDSNSIDEYKADYGKTLVTTYARMVGRPGRIVAWPTGRYAVMGAAQASDTVFSILARARDRGDKKASHEELDELRQKVKQNYEEQTDIRYGAARGWVDAIVQPHETREALVQLLEYVSRPTPKARFHTGVIQV